MGRMLKPYTYDLQVIRLDITDGPLELNEGDTANFVLSMRQQATGSYKRELGIRGLRQHEEYPDWYQFDPGHPRLLGPNFTPDVLYNPNLQKGIMGIGLLIDECLDRYTKITPH